MARKPRKLGKRQQAIADKYAHILEAGRIREALGTRNYNKKLSLPRELSKLSRQSKSLDKQIVQAQRDRIDARPIIKRKWAVENQLKESRRLLYDLELRTRVSSGSIQVGDKVIDLPGVELNEEQKAVINRLARSLVEYTTGDMNITKFYNEYDFDIINETSLTLFAIGEGLI